MRQKPLQANQLLVVALIVGIALFSTASVHAQEDLSFVYGTNHFNGAAYNSTFIPPSIDTFYLISNQTSMIASRYTRVFYWPLTNELKPDWDTANVIVEGGMEIFKNNNLIDVIEMTNYVIQYDGTNKFETLQLYLGEEAVAARQNFEDLQAQYREDLFNYYEEMNRYRQAFQAALAELQAGNITEDQLPEPPEPQQDLTLFSTNLLVGFPVNLPEGTYTIQLRLPDGSIQHDSIKKLVVFSPIQEGIGYNIFTEERWTAPEISEQENETIYSLPGKKIFLEPYYQIEFNELYYTRLNNPQDKQARADRNVWVPFQSMSKAQLVVNHDSIQDLQPYFVRQVAGSTLGYEILPYNPDSDREASFSGFDITVDASEINIELKDLGGNALPFSQREIRILQTNNSIWIYVLSSIPLVGGLITVLLRRKAVDTEKMNGQEF